MSKKIYGKVYSAASNSVGPNESVDKNYSHNSSFGLSGHIEAFLNNGENQNVSATLENLNFPEITEILKGNENGGNSSSVSVGRSKRDRK